MKLRDRPEFKSKSMVMTFAPDATVFAAVQAMSQKNYGAVVVIDPERKPIGIVTERDFMRRLLNQSLNPQTTTLADIMTTDLKLARADDDLLEWLMQMSNDRFRHLPVVDDDGRIIAMMSQGDFVSYTWPQLLNRLSEQARASFDVNPSMYFAIAGVIMFMILVLAAIVVMK